jgi:hypothetical protein
MNFHPIGSCEEGHGRLRIYELMHFNDLLIHLRSQALGAVSVIITGAGLFVGHQALVRLFTAAPPLVPFQACKGRSVDDCGAGRA